MIPKHVLVGGTLVIGALSALTLSHLVRHGSIERRWENTWKARAHLLSLAAAQEALRTGDLDGNGIADYWTGDVAGLARFGLIAPDFAEADARPLDPFARRPKPLDGYYFAVLEIDGVPALRRATRYAFVAFPADGRPGSRTIYIDEGGYPVHRDGIWTGGFRCPTEAERIEWGRCWGG